MEYLIRWYLATGIAFALWVWSVDVYTDKTEPVGLRILGHVVIVLGWLPLLAYTIRMKLTGKEIKGIKHDRK